MMCNSYAPLTFWVKQHWRYETKWITQRARICSYLLSPRCRQSKKCCPLNIIHDTNCIGTYIHCKKVPRPIIGLFSDILVAVSFQFGASELYILSATEPLFLLLPFSHFSFLLATPTFGSTSSFFIELHGSSVLHSSQGVKLLARF